MSPWDNLALAPREAFAVLGLQPGASGDAIRKAYRRQALTTHPDTGGSHEGMVALNRAKDAAMAWAERRSA